MIVPSPRLLWWTALLGVPLATAAGLSPSFAVAGVLILSALVVLAAVDAFLGSARIERIALLTPLFLRFTKDVPATLPVRIENGLPDAVRLRIALEVGQTIVFPGLPDRVQEAEVPPGASQIDWPVVCRTRGDHPLSALHLEVPSPMGLWLAREPRTSQFLFRVYPNLRDRATAALFRKTAQPGFRMHRQVGKGREFENLRHYIPGDSFEDIHWKATARRAFPVVKLYRVEHAQEVYAVIDSSRLSAREGILESYVDAALHLALVAEHHGDRFGLVTFSDRTDKFVRARNGLDHFRLCRETIYNLRAARVSPGFRDVFTALQVNLRRRSLLVFFTSLDDALLAETFEREVPLLSRRHLVLVNITETAGMQPLFRGEPPDSLEKLYDGLAGQMLWNRMRKLQIALGQRGVRLTMVQPGKIKAQVTSEYLEVKRRQVL